MNENIKYYLLYAVAYGILLLLGEIIFRFLKGGHTWSRSFAHITAGIISLPFPWLFTSHWWVLILAVQSGLVLWTTRRLKMIPSHHRIAGKSTGSFLFFASVYLCYIASLFFGRKELYMVPILLLSISDVAAVQVGRRYGKRGIRRKKLTDGTSKTVAGSTAFFISALPVLFFSFYICIHWNLLASIFISLLIAVLSTAVEAMSPYGTDNLFVPLTVLIIMQIIFVM